MSDPRPPLRLLPLGDTLKREPDLSGSEVAPLDTDRSRLVWDDADPIPSKFVLGAGVAAALAGGAGLAFLIASALFAR